MHFFDQNENIDPTILNANLREIEQLVGKTALHNKELQIRLGMSSLLMNNFASFTQNLSTYKNHLVQNMTDDEVGDIPALSLGQGTLTNAQLEAGVIGIEYESEHSRIAFQENSFGEHIPALSSTFSAEGVTLEHPELIFSRDAAWAQVLDTQSVIINAAFPPAIRNNYNYVKVFSILPNSAVRLVTPALGSNLSNRLATFPEGYFASEMSIESLGVNMGNGTYLHSVGLVDIGYRKFFDEGLIIKEIPITAAYYATLAGAELDFLHDLNNERLSQIASLIITQKDSSGSTVGTTYASDTDDYPLASAININTSAVTLEVAIHLRKYSNSSPLLRGIKLQLTRTT
jgi:hypothetical protein